jgi:hypothetical protein
VTRESIIRLNLQYSTRESISARLKRSVGVLTIIDIPHEFCRSTLCHFRMSGLELLHSTHPSRRRDEDLEYQPSSLAEIGKGEEEAWKKLWHVIAAYSPDLDILYREVSRSRIPIQNCFCLSDGPLTSSKPLAFLHYARFRCKPASAQVHDDCFCEARPRACLARFLIGQFQIPSYYIRVDILTS